MFNLQLWSFPSLFPIIPHPSFHPTFSLFFLTSLSSCFHDNGDGWLSAVAIAMGNDVLRSGGWIWPILFSVVEAPACAARMLFFRSPFQIPNSELSTQHKTQELTTE